MIFSSTNNDRQLIFWWRLPVLISKVSVYFSHGSLVSRSCFNVRKYFFVKNWWFFIGIYFYPYLSYHYHLIKFYLFNVTDITMEFLSIHFRFIIPMCQGQTMVCLLGETFNQILCLVRKQILVWKSPNEGSNPARLVSKEYSTRENISVLFSSKAFH